MGHCVHARPRVWKRLHCFGYRGVSDVDCKRRRCKQHGEDGSPIFPMTGVGWSWGCAGPRLQVCMVGISFCLQLRVVWSVHTHTFNGVPNNNNNNTIWEGSVLTGEEPPLHSGELKHAPLPSRRPNPIPAIPPYVVRTPHLHGAPTTEETVKLWYKRQQKKFLKQVQEKRKEETFSSEKWKNKKQEKKTKTGEKKVGKKEKSAQRCVTSRNVAQNLIFHIRTVKRNRNENWGPKKIRFWAPNKDKEMKEHERKWKKIKEHERTWKNMKEHERK